MTGVLGVDGCRGGWVGALVDGDARAPGTGSPTSGRRSRCRWTRSPSTCRSACRPSGRRDCDLLAKAALGRAHSRVFLAPPRGVLSAGSYDEAGRLHRELTGGLGMSVQTWHLVPKIREVDAVADDPRLVEVHPELSLAELAGTGPLVSKKTAAGRAARLAVLRGWLPGLDDGAERRRRAGRAGGGVVGAAMAGRAGPDAARAPAVRRAGPPDADRDLTAERQAGDAVSVSRVDGGRRVVVRGARDGQVRRTERPVVRALGVPQRRHHVDRVDTHPRAAVDVPVAGSRVDHRPHPLVRTACSAERAPVRGIDRR